MHSYFDESSSVGWKKYSFSFFLKTLQSNPLTISHSYRFPHKTLHPNKHKMSHHHHTSSSFASCFFPKSDNKHHNENSAPPPPPPPPPISGKPNLTTCLYQTNLGLFSFTWSQTLMGHSLHLNLHPFDLSFHLQIKPFIFWKKHGSKKLTTTTTPKIQVFWDLSRVKFGSGPEPQSGFYISVVVDEHMTLVVGDLTKEAYAKTKAQKAERNLSTLHQQQQQLLLRREHVFGTKVYTTKTKFGGKNREITINCNVSKDARLCISVDHKKVLVIKRLKWKFRGNERIEVDGVPIQISWDVYNWLFEDLNNGHAVFMFRFENLDNEKEAEGKQNGDVLWQQQQQSSGSCNFGLNGIEWRKMRKSLMRTARSSSSSSISISSAASSSACSSSVMEWASSADECELSPAGPHGFSLLVYVWKK